LETAAMEQHDDEEVSKSRQTPRKA